MEVSMERLEAELDAFLQERAASGDYESFQGLIAGWTLFVDRVVPGDDPDAEGWYSILAKPGQRPTTTLGHLTAGQARTAGGYTAAAIERYLDDE